YRYAITDTLQPIIEASASARRPAGDPKADRQRYLVRGHGSHLLDTARYLGGPLVAIPARLSTKQDTYCWFLGLGLGNGRLRPLGGATAVDGLASVRGMVALARSVESGDWVRLADMSGGL